MMKPTIHSNGTSKAQLFEQYTSALTAVNEALTELRRAQPHGRDYYVQSQNAINEAMVEHLARIQKLESVANELECLAIAVDEVRAYQTF